MSKFNLKVLLEAFTMKCLQKYFSYSFIFWTLKGTMRMGMPTCAPFTTSAKTQLLFFYSWHKLSEILILMGISLDVSDTAMIACWLHSSVFTWSWDYDGKLPGLDAGWVENKQLGFAWTLQPSIQNNHSYFGQISQKYVSSENSTFHNI